MSFFLQLFVWDSVSWEKRKSRLFQMAGGKLPTSPSDTHVQFHQDQNHFLAVHKTHLGIYEARELTFVKQVCALSLSLSYDKQAFFDCSLFI
jgi:hypothetical protein